MGNLLRNCNNDLSPASHFHTLSISLSLFSPLEMLLALHLFIHESDIQSHHLIAPLELWTVIDSHDEQFVC